MSSVFLSYAHEDAKWAERLAQHLKLRGLSVWFDDSELAPGSNWAEQSGKALSQADAMVVLISPASMASPSVGKEIDFALTQPRFKNRLIPVILHPTKKMPWILEKQKVVKVAPGMTAKGMERMVDELVAAVA